MKFYTLQLFQRAPPAPARGQWSPALNMQFCPHCQTLNDKNGTTCTRCSQPLVAFGRGPAPPATGGFEFARRMTRGDIDDVVPSPMRQRDVDPAPGEVSRQPLFSGKLALVLGAAALSSVALYAMLGSEQLRSSVGDLTERLASIRGPKAQDGTNAFGKYAPSRDVLAPSRPLAAISPKASAMPGAAAVGATDNSDRGASAVAPRGITPDAQAPAALPATALKPAVIPPEPTRLDSGSADARRSARADTASRPGAAGAASPAPGAVARVDEPPAQFVARAANQPAAPSAGGCSDAVKTLGLCDTPIKTRTGNP